MESIERSNGCVARNTLIREMGMPVGICEDIISVRYPYEVLFVESRKRKEDC